MALAYLISRVELNDLFESQAPPTFRAFVVDHGARAGSVDEAGSVVERLRRLGRIYELLSNMGKMLTYPGIPAEVLTLDWLGDEPRVLPNFESRARTLRFQALGRACVRHGITALLLAHHKDDQAETVLGRIVERYTGPGLAGVRSWGGIPECEEIYGAGLAGGRFHGRRIGLEDTQQAERSQRIIKKVTPPVGIFKMQEAPAGVSIHRPLLGFTKEDLQKTCEQNGVEWVEDQTNKDRTLTTRNTMRYLLQSGRLPQALSAPRLLAAREKAHRVLRQCQELVALWIEETQIRFFHMRSGVMVAILPRNLIHRSKRTHSLMHRKAVEWYLRYLSEWVSPSLHVDFKYDFEIERCFLPAAGREVQFNAGGVLWTPVLKEVVGDPAWMARREPPRRSQRPDFEKCQWSSLQHETGGQWKSWDGRFWIKVKSRRNGGVSCRAFAPHNIRSLRHTVAREWLDPLEASMKMIKPVDARNSLPMLVEPESNAILAFPTLDVKMQESIEYPLVFEARYKALPISL